MFDRQKEIHIPEEYDESVKDLIEEALVSESGGTNQVRILQIGNSKGENKIFMTKEEIYGEQDGRYVIENRDSAHPLDCGCIATNNTRVAGEDYLTGAICCINHLLLCDKCRRSVAVFNAKELKHKVYCKPCYKKGIASYIAFSPFRMIREILYGFAGLEVEYDQSAISHHLRNGLTNEQPTHAPQARQWSRENPQGQAALRGDNTGRVIR